MAKQWMFALCGSTFVLGVRADDLSDFSNNLATDIAPLFVLFGESMTKQYLSESTSFLDYFIFAMAPIGILTAIVSAIRVCGHSSLRAFIGRSQEGEGTVEAELCTSTSRDVCELFNRGGITRVLGKPNILELIYLPEIQSLKLVRDYLDKAENTEPPHSWWQREDDSFHLFGKPRGQRESVIFAPNPNLSLNVGIVKRADWILGAIAATGFVLQAGILALAGTGVWILGWNLNGADSSASRDYAPVMFIAGTVLMCVGMWSCAALIGQTTHEVRFRRMENPQDDATKPAKPPRLLWLQPGPQVIGDQSFDPFAYFENTSNKPLQTWTSSRKDFDERFETYTSLAVFAVLVGYISQFIGLRGMKAWVSLAQLGITIIMSVLRGCLRMQRLGRNDNLLLSMPDLVSGHELDWLSFEIVEVENAREEGRGGGKGGKGEETDRARKALSWHVTGEFEDAAPSKSKEIQARIGVQLSPTKSAEDGSERAQDCAALLSIRRQLANLTGNLTLDEVSDLEHQKWRDTRVKVRTKALALCNAVCQAAERLWKRRQWKYQAQGTHRADEQERFIPSQMRLATETQLVGITLRPPPDESGPGWKMDAAQVEAILGLWMWTLISDERVVKQDTSHQKGSRAEDIQCLRIVSAGLDDGSWDREVNKQGEMDLWLGSNAITLLENNLTLCKQTRRGIGTLWVPGVKNSPELVPLDSEHNAMSPMRLCGWHSIHGRPRPITSESETLSIHQQENQSVKLRVQVTPAGGSLLDLCAQELFASLIMSFLSILNVESTTVVENSGLIQLENPTVATFAEAFTEHSLGSSTEAILCLVPAFRTKLLLPTAEDMLPALLQAADAYRKASEWDKAQTLLRWACARYALVHGEPEENSATSPSDRDSPFTRALRATGELYRWSLASHDPSGERKEFGRNGIQWMAETYPSAGPSIPEAIEILDCYEALAQRVTTPSADRNSPPSDRTIKRVAGRLVQAIQDKNREDTLYYLCFVKTGDLGYKPLQPVLPLAVRNDWSEVVDALLEMKADLNSQDEHRRTALFYCAESGRDSYAKRLVDLGAFLDQPDDEQQTPLFVASRLGHWKVVELLLNTGQVNIEVEDKEGRTPLWWAASSGHEAVVRLLLERGVDAAVTGSGSRRRPILRAAENGQEAVVRLLLENGVDIESDASGWTPLTCAATNGHEALVRLLLEMGANVEGKGIGGSTRTPLSFAVEFGHEDVVRLLLEMGADVEGMIRAPWKSGQTPLSYAAEKGHELLVRLLLERGANIHSRGVMGRTPLLWAAHGGHEAIVRILLEMGADIEAVGRTGGNGRTALSFAAGAGNEGMVRLLLEKGADVESKDIYRMTPLSYATQGRHEAVVRLLQPKA